MPNNLLFFTYADLQQELPGIKQEADFHAGLFNYGMAEGHLLFSREQYADIPSLSISLIDFREDIFLFHYSGHADNDILELGTGKKNTSKGIATLLAACPNLQVIVLNGCSTAAHIAKLREAGVKAVIIATNWSVGNIPALLFSQRFYVAIQRGEHVENAFDEAIAHVVLSDIAEIERGSEVSQTKQGKQPVWGMYATPDLAPSDIRLPFRRTYPAKRVPNPGYFIGRQTNLERISSILGRDSPAAICITGPLGIGKSALCRQVLWSPAILKKFGQRIFFVNCENTNSTNDVKFALGDKLGILPKSDLESQIWERLNGSPTLIALDNAETPFGLDQNKFQLFLQDLFALGNISLLLTIRGQNPPAGLQWEVPIEKLHKVNVDEAREIFVGIAGVKNFLNDPHLGELLSRLDGNPLVLVLIARLAEAENRLQPLLKRWDRIGSGIFSEGKFAHAVELALASKRMPSEGRKLFRILSILPLGIHRYQLNFLAPGYGQAGARALFTFGLATYDELQRLQLPAPVRAYRKNIYKPSSKEITPIIDHYYELVATAQGLGENNGEIIAAKLVPELGNIEKVIDLAFDYNQEKAILATLHLSRFIAFTRLGNTHLLLRALQVARAFNYKHLIARCLDHLRKIRAILTLDYPDAGKNFTKVFESPKHPTTKIEMAKSLLNLGDFAFFEGRMLDADSYYRSALQRFSDTNYEIGLAVCFLRIAELAVQKEDLAEAEIILRKAQYLFKKNESTIGRASCLLQLGEIAFREMKYEKAEERYTLALELVEQINHLDYIARIQEALGKIAFGNSNFLVAIQNYRKASMVYKSNPEIPGRAKCLQNLGEAYLHQPESIQPAQVNLGTALHLFQRDNNRLGEAECKRLLAIAAFQDEDYDLAMTLFTNALSIFKPLNQLSYTATCMRSLGDFYTFLKDFQRAQAIYDEALLLFAEERDEIGIAECLWSLGDMNFQKAHLIYAKEYWLQTIKRYEQYQDDTALIELYENLTQVTQDEERENFQMKAERLREKLINP